MHENKFFRSTKDFWILFATLISIPFFIMAVGFVVKGLTSDTGSIFETGLVFALIGLPFFVILIALLIKHRKRSVLINQLKKSGKMVMGIITEVGVAPTAYLRGQNPAFIVCSVTIHGNNHSFVSNWLKPGIDNRILGLTVPVYIDSNDPGRYYVHCDGIAL